MTNYRKIKLGILIGLGVITIASTTVELYKWHDSYSKIEKNQIQTFEGLWSTIWDSNKKTFNSNLDNNVIAKLEELSSTPKDKLKVDLAKTSVNLMQVHFNKSSLNQIINASNQYYQNEEKDNDFKEQESLNKSILEEIEQLIKQLNDTNSKIELKNEQLNFDQSSTEEFQLNTINTKLNWDALDSINKNINDFNFLIKRQVEENNIKNQQQKIIDLKTKLDEFVKETKDYQDKIKQNYITSKDFKELINKIYSIDIAKNSDYFDKFKELDFQNTNQKYTIKFSKTFFEKNTDFKKYETQLNDIDLNVNLIVDLTKVKSKSEESKVEDFKFTNKLEINGNDNDLINIHSFTNLKITIDQTQKMKQYLEETPTTSSSSSQQTRNSNSTTQPNRTGRTNR